MNLRILPITVGTYEMIDPLRRTSYRTRDVELRLIPFGCWTAWAGLAALGMFAWSVVPLLLLVPVMQVWPLSGGPSIMLHSRRLPPESR